MAIKQTAGRQQLGDFALKFAQLNDDVLFGEVWSREDKLSLRDRSLVTVVSLMSQGLTDSSFRFHLEEAKKNGITKVEIAEILTHAAFYAGWPKAWSLTRNPWHVREYTPEQLRRLLATRFSEVETLGVFGNKKVMDYYEENRRSVERFTRFDILDLQHRLPRWMLQLPYDILNRMNRRKLLEKNTGLTTSIRMDDYAVEPVGDKCFDLFYVATK